MEDINMKTCSVCGTECQDGERFCQNCGAEFYSEPTTSNTTQQTYQQNSYNQQNPYNQQQSYQQNPYAQYNNMNQNTYQNQQFDVNWTNEQAIITKANTSKVLGIISFFINPLLILSILAIVMGNNAMKMASPQNIVAQSSAKVGKTCGIVSLILYAVILIVYIIAIVCFASAGVLYEYSL